MKCLDHHSEIGQDQLLLFDLNLYFFVRVLSILFLTGNEMVWDLRGFVPDRFFLKACKIL